MMPSWSSLISSSDSEQSIPRASTPAMTPSRTWMPFGTVVPGSATATREPDTAFGAPATICRRWSPRSTWWTHSGLREPGWGSCDVTLPTRSAERSTGITSSTFQPAIVRISAACCGVRSRMPARSHSHS